MNLNILKYTLLLARRRRHLLDAKAVRRTHWWWSYLQLLLHRLDSVLLAGQIGSGVAALSRQVQDLTVTFLPHLIISLHRQISMTHPMFHHLHLLDQQLSSLSNAHIQREPPDALCLTTKSDLLLWLNWCQKQIKLKYFILHKERFFAMWHYFWPLNIFTLNFQYCNTVKKIIMSEHQNVYFY